MEISIKLSKEEKNRVCTWLTILFKVNNYCAVCEEQRSKIPSSPKEEDWGFYYLHGNPSYYSAPLVIEDGLLEAAIVGLSSIFNWGDSGEGIENNYRNNVLQVKDEIIRRTAEKLGYTDTNVFEDYIKKIINIRNQLIAHFDGSVADYSEDFFVRYDINGNLVEKVPGIKKWKAPIAHFSHDEIVELKDITIKMHESLIEILKDIDNQDLEKL